jgi:uncharacterized membrane protein YccC
MMMKPHFTAEIQLGHILQAAALLGAVLGGYYSLRSWEAEQFAAQNLRLSLVEQDQRQRRDDEVSWRTEMRNSMQSFNSNVTQLSQTFNTTVTQLSREISDLRVSLAKVEPKK